MKVKIIIDSDLCTGCGVCLDFCPYEIFELQETSSGVVAKAINPDNCTFCNTCVGQCSTGAITITLNE